VVGERHITREELLETGNLVETEGSVVQSTQPQSSLLSSQQSRPAMAARTYEAGPLMASGASVAKTYASPSTVTYSSAPAVSQGMTYATYPATTLGAENVQFVQPVQQMSMMTAPVAHRGDFFDVFDTNHDGVIDRSEFQQAAATMNVGGYKAGTLSGGPVAVI
jgi:hypothetical protein